MSGHIVLWIVLTTVAFVFFALAMCAGRDVLDDQQVFRTDKLSEDALCRVFVGIGAAIALFVFYDIFSFFHPIPASLNGAPAR